MSATMRPSRGDVWVVDFGMPRGHEQGYERPAVVISTNDLNHGPAGICIVVPLTTTHRRVPSHVEVLPPEGGVKVRSFITPEDIRSVSFERFGAYWGRVSKATLDATVDWLGALLEL